MQDIQIKCDKKPTLLKVKLSVNVPQKIRLMVFNPNRPKTYYTNRVKTISGVAEFEVRMPQNCDIVVLKVVSMNGSSNGINIISVDKSNLNQYIPCYSQSNIQSFVKFAQEFSEQASILSTGTYFSDDKKYRIDYFDIIKQNGKPIQTPARISNINGRMEVSKKHFVEYTIPMRMAILLHEFSHFNLNLVQQDEIEADLNALKIYLGMGYPVIEAHNSFLNVFKRSPSEQNKERYQYIKSFIDNFEEMKYRICL
jgi:hypothetical protein